MTQPEAFSLADAGSYDPVAEVYGRWAARLLQPLVERLLDLAQAGAEARILDIGTGTGVVALEAARRGASVVGVDLSEGMLAYAARSAQAAGLAPAVELRRMDAQALDLPDATFDAVTSLFALLHFPDPETALLEMRRVLRPGGRVVVGVGSPPPFGSLAAWRRAGARLGQRLNAARGLELQAPRFLEALVERRLPPPHDALETEHARRAHARPPGLAALVRGAGFEAVRSEWQDHEIVLDSADAFWELQSSYSSSARKRLAQATSADREALRREFDTTCQAVLGRSGRLVYHYAALIVSARRPGSGSV